MTNEFFEFLKFAIEEDIALSQSDTQKLYDFALKLTEIQARAHNGNQDWGPEYTQVMFTNHLNFIIAQTKEVVLKVKKLAAEHA